MKLKCSREREGAIGRSRCATALADRACYPEGICWCAALDRTRHAMRLAPLTWGMEKRTLLLSEEHPDTIPNRGGGRVHDLSTRRLLVRAILILRGETFRRALVPRGGVVLPCHRVGS